MDVRRHGKSEARQSAAIMLVLLLLWTLFMLANLSQSADQALTLQPVLAQAPAGQSQDAAADRAPSEPAQPESAAAVVPTPLTFSDHPFGIADRQIVDFFTRNGGVPVFGYPVSNKFRFVGVDTQIFQRRVVQLGPDGPRLLNLLDDDLFPYSQINGSALPSSDPTLVNETPHVGDPDYVSAMQEFVRTHVPDTFNGQAVNFLSTFLSTAGCPADESCDDMTAFQKGLDMWGAPTSEAQADHSNPNFIYQRFQQGIMHFDAGCGCTQGVLVGEYFRDVLSGGNLPDDLDAQARGSRWYAAVAEAWPDTDFIASGIPLLAQRASAPAFVSLPTEVPTQTPRPAPPQLSAPVASGGLGGGGGGGGTSGAGITISGSGSRSGSSGGGGSASHGGGGGSGSGSSGGGGGASAGGGGATPPTSTPSPVPVPPTATPTSTVNSSPTPTSTPAGNPMAGQPCPDSVHAQYVVQGPDGKQYPTWHPAVDPTFGCYFGHEHGADPRSSHIFTSMPAFGYVGGLINDNEPHEGFKVFVANAGTATEGRILNADELVVFHMGTAGPSRYTTQFHSMIYDYVARDGSSREAHVQGMADTGPTSQDGSACNVLGAKSFSTVGCNNDYEVWQGATFQLIHPSDPFTDVLSTRITMTFSPAVFDPITTRDPRDNKVLIYTQKYRGDPNIDPLSTKSKYLGCSREAYFGPNYWHNAGQSTVYYSDVYGHVNPSGPDAAHPLRQVIAAVNSTSNDQFKLPSASCAPGIRSPN